MKIRLAYLGMAGFLVFTAKVPMLRTDITQQNKQAVIQAVNKTIMPETPKKVEFVVEEEADPLSITPAMRAMIPREMEGRREAIEIGYQKIVEQFGEGEWNAFYELIKRESGWNPNAQNPRSSAYGLGQFLDSTWAGTGISKTNNPEKQIEAIVVYIKNRYGNPTNTLSFWRQNNWY